MLRAFSVHLFHYKEQKIKEKSSRFYHGIYQPQSISSLEQANLQITAKTILTYNESLEYFRELYMSRDMN
ncbi:hypothetical protein Cs308_0348 [Candidatus Chlamydia sanziniae]|uniref:Uncharacterized protein n=1 Tax=Candidatus Chlamydia sanziniae TaxID=1806891 RepID=A0A1A9HU65_9CHLA|nr:hypothetical protein Cs308_0348 [Candidatus Chlamydia sanziniae]